jgi:hypothetical protein
MEEARLVRKFKRIRSKVNDLGMEIDILEKDVFWVFEKFGDDWASYTCGTLDQLEGFIEGYGSKDK